jgi:DNA-binding Lrp family transcriptional regulator
MITAEESLIEKTLTLIVISEGPSYVEEPFAFIFLNTQSVHLERVKEKLLTLSPVLSADTVFGPYDVICAVRSKDSDKLARFLFQIQREIPGITGTMTAFVTSLY